MNFTCERPYAFYGLLLIIPAVIITFFQYRKIIRNKSVFMTDKNNSIASKRLARFPKVILCRTIFRIVAWVLLVLAYAGFSWGTYLEPVQKNGNAVSFVFDISYSMMANDAPDKKTRLEAAANYAQMLLSHMKGIPVTVVLAKGDGVLVVPLTEDKAVVETLLESLNPKLISSVGTSLGKGIIAAHKGFPTNSSLANRIWVFTDGDETDGLLEKSILDCVRSGVSVSLIGFGSEQEIQVIAGDGKTAGYTTLKSEKMKKIVANVEKNSSAEIKNGVTVNYIDATEAGSALKLLKTVSPKFNSKYESNSITYELKPVKRYSLFLGLAIFFFILGFFVTEFDIDNIMSKFKKTSIISLCICCTLFTSCTTRIEGSTSILKSSWAWYQRKYNEATAGYLQTVVDAKQAQDDILEQYAVYDLATTYLMQNENDAALERYSQIKDDSPKAVRYSTFYNMGIIAHRSGEYKKAVECFIEALKIDNTKTSAKINLELSRVKAEKEAKGKENSLNSVSANNGKSSKENAIFNVIREYDKQQWKNSESTQNSNSAIDF